MHVQVNLHFNAHYIILKGVENVVSTVMIYFWITKLCVEINSN